MATPPIITADWLQTQLAADSTSVQVIDGSWHLASNGRDAAAEFLAAHIPGSVRLDVDVVAARTPAPPSRMLPPSELFAAEVGRLGFRRDAHLVVYDTVGLYSAARVWWVFRAHRHDRISVLDGGLPAWRGASGPIESGPAAPLPVTDWNPRPVDPAAVRDWRAVLANIDTRAEQLVDVRPAANFSGSAAAHYPGVRAGHIPGAINLPQRDLLQSDGRFRSPAEIRAIVAASGIDIARPVVATCGSGVTACILALALEIVGVPPCAVYDGSWEEWGQRLDLPIEH